MNNKEYQELLRALYTELCRTDYVVYLGGSPKVPYLSHGPIYEVYAETVAFEANHPDLDGPRLAQAAKREVANTWEMYEPVHNLATATGGGVEVELP